MAVFDIGPRLVEGEIRCCESQIQYYRRRMWKAIFSFRWRSARNNWNLMNCAKQSLRNLVQEIKKKRQNA
jgi:hypothetical protein